MTIPKIGYGTFKLKETCEEMVLAALETGYRHIDTAQFYDNEEEVGMAIRGSSVAREDIFLTTKVWPTNLAKEDFLKSTEESLRKLDSDYVDLLLIHWPTDKVPLEESLTELAKAKEKGYAKNIGVSNFNTKLLQQVLDFGIQPITNQVEYHPALNQDKLLDVVRQNELTITAYCPIGNARYLDNPVLLSLAKTKEKTVAQIMLRWHIQQEIVIPIPKSGNRKRIKENFEVFDFELSDEEMRLVSSLQHAEGRIIRPKGIVFD